MNRHTRRYLAALCILFLLPTLLIAARLAAGSGFAFEIPLMMQIHQHTPDIFFPLALLLHYLGKTHIAVPLVTAVCLVLIWRGHRRMAAFCALSALIPTLNMLLFKSMIARPRPSLWPHLVVEHNFSFPSGHSTFAAAVAVMLTVGFYRTPYRRTACIIGLTFALLTGFSRIYLGVHYPTDVWAGWTNGLLVSLLTARILLKPDHNNPRQNLP